MIEVVYVWPDGREEVRYRRPAGSEDASRFAEVVAALRERLGEKCPYFIRESQ
jgi:hypothetical protein